MPPSVLIKAARHLTAGSLLLLLPLLLGTCVPVNRQFRQPADGIPVFVVSNGFHTDVVFPLREPRTGTDWLSFLENPAWATQFGQYEYAALGWGDEGFYLASYGGRMPGLGTTLRAIFWPTPTLMHVSFYRHAPKPGPRAVVVRVSEAQFRALAGSVQASFARDSTGCLQPLPAPGYTPTDFFFRANGSYHAFRTCNDWTNQALQQAGIRAAWKAPLAPSVLHQLRRAQ
jgi:uncharacterized protein (TIGR02117 family)